MDVMLICFLIRLISMQELIQLRTNVMLPDSQHRHNLFYNNVLYLFLCPFRDSLLYILMSYDHIIDRCMTIRSQRFCFSRTLLYILNDSISQ